MLHCPSFQAKKKNTHGFGNWMLPSWGGKGRGRTCCGGVFKTGRQKFQPGNYVLCSVVLYLWVLSMELASFLQWCIISVSSNYATSFLQWRIIFMSSKYGAFFISAVVHYIWVLSMQLASFLQWLIISVSSKYAACFISAVAHSICELYT